jgi:hypothetical protein
MITNQLSSAICLSGDSDSTVKPVPLGLEGYPTEIAVKVGTEEKKIPVSYLEKDAAETGPYRHPVTGQEFELDEARMDMWADKFNKMRAAGVEIPCPIDHSEKAEDNRGFTVKLRRDGNKLRFTSQVVGEDGALLALRNRCSVKINPNFVDEKKRNWGEAIEHISFTPIPVISGQGPFVPIAASRGGTPILILSKRSDPMPLNEQLVKSLRQRLGAADDVAEDKLVEQAVAKLGEVIPKLAEAEPALALSRTQADTITTLTRERDAAKTALAAANKAPDLDILKESAANKVEKIELLLSKGKCTKPQAEKLKKALADGDKPSVLMLSKTGPAGAPIDIAIDILDMNTPFTGTFSGMQGVPDPNNPNPAVTPERKKELLAHAGL